MKKSKILVVGATGTVGGEVVRLLAEHSDCEVIAAVRDFEKAADLAQGDVEFRELDLDRGETLGPALAGVQRALLLTSYTVDMLKQSKRFLDVAKEESVQHIVHIGASGAPTNEVAHWTWHQMIESYIEKKGFSWTHLQPEAFMQNVTAPGGFGWLNGNQLVNFLGTATWSWVDGRDVAAVAAKALLEPEVYDGKTIRLGYEAASLVEVAAQLSAVSGREITVVDQSPEAFRDGAIAAGVDAAYIGSVYSQFVMDAAGDMPESGTTFDNFEEIVGRPPRMWNDVALELYKS